MMLRRSASAPFRIDGGAPVRFFRTFGEIDPTFFFHAEKRSDAFELQVFPV